MAWQQPGGPSWEQLQAQALQQAFGYQPAVGYAQAQQQQQQQQYAQYAQALGAWGAQAQAATTPATKVDPAISLAANMQMQRMTSQVGGLGVAAARPMGSSAGKTKEAEILAAEFKTKVTKYTEDYASAEMNTKIVMESSKLDVDNENATAVSLKSSYESVDKQAEKLKKLMETLLQESVDAMKAGFQSAASANEFKKLQSKVRTLWLSCTQQVIRLKPRVAKAQAAAVAKAQEKKDTDAFKVLLAKAKNEVTAADNAVNAVTKQANPVVASPPEEGEARDKKVTSIETAAVEAIKKVDAAAADLKEKIKAVQGYTPEAKKTSLASLLELQKKVGDALKTASVYKNFKVTLPKLAEHHKVITEISGKISAHEAPVSKALELSKATVLTKVKIGQIDKHLEPVEATLKEASVALMKIKATDAITVDKVAKLRSRFQDLQDKIKEVKTKIKAPKDVLLSEDAIVSAKDMLAKAEDSWAECQLAEMPFLMGVEVLDEEENDKALGKCEETAKTTVAGIVATRNHVRVKTAECARYEKDLAASTKKELDPIFKSLDALDVKCKKYLNELVERKVLPMLTEAFDAVASFQKAAKAAEAAGKSFSAGNLEEEATETLTKAVDECKKAVLAAAQAGQSARSLAQKGQQKAGAKNDHPSVIAMKKDMADDEAKLAAVRASMSRAQQFVKTHNALEAGEAKLKEAEDAVAKAKKSVPKGDFSVESADALDANCLAATVLIKHAGNSLQGAVATAGSKAKELLTKLQDQKNDLLKTCSDLQTSTKEKREAARSIGFLADADTKTTEAEGAATKMEESEAPFLIGAAMKDSKQTLEILEKCTEAGKAVAAAIGAAKASNNKMASASQKYGEAAAKQIKDGLADSNKRLKEVITKLDKFGQESKDRMKEARMAEAVERTDALEAAGKKLAAAAEPFTKEGGENMSEADAEAPLKAFEEIEKETNLALNALTSFLLTRQGEQKGNQEHLLALKGMQERAKKVKEPIAEMKKATAPHEKRALGKKLLGEVKELTATLDGEVKKATEACASLNEDGGDQFLVGNSLQALANALQAHMKKKELTLDECPGMPTKNRIKEKDFVKYLTDLPETIGHDELSAFSDARRLAIFKSIATSDRGVSKDAFCKIFNQSYNCMKATVLTDKYEVDGSETICKVAPNTIVQLLGQAKTNEAKLTRSECKIGEQTGWITVDSMTPVAPFKAFCMAMDKTVNEASLAVVKVSTAVSGKMKQGGPDGGAGPLKDARDEMAKCKNDILKAMSAMEEIKTKKESAKKSFNAKELSEKNAHIEARNQKEAAPFLEAPKATIDALEAATKSVEAAGAPMVALTGDELNAFATPASVLEEVKNSGDAAKDKASEAKSAMDEQLKAVMAVTPQTGGTAFAKTQLKSLSMKLQELNNKSSKIISSISQKCKSMTAVKMEPAAAGLRAAAQKKGKTIEEFFNSLKKGDKIPEATFVKTLKSLEIESGSLSHELATLVCRKLLAEEEDGVSKDAFMKFVVLYYKIVRTIAFTDKFDITGGSVLRKGEEGEVVEVLEGPKTDEANGMTRVRGRCVDDDKVVGWVTLSGSKGTAFLIKTTRPTPKAVPAAKETVPAAKA